MAGQSNRAALARAGFDDSARADQLLADPALSAHLDSNSTAALIDALGHTADPDRALLALVRLAETDADLVPLWRFEEGARHLLALIGGSSFWADYLYAHPDEVATVLAAEDALALPPTYLRSRMLESVGADPESDTPTASVRAADGGLDDMRRTYRHFMLAIAAQDLASAEPTELFTQVGGTLADLAAAALETALALARAELVDGGEGVRLSILGMGKTGGRELNYISDVDVIYIAQAAKDADLSEEEATSIGNKLAATCAKMCSMPSREMPLWEVDPNLRPEGKNGPLVRTLASHIAYYERWAKTWEFQALLKARHVAGDRELSQEYMAALTPMVWNAVEREHFVEDAQAMRRRVENHVPPAEADRQIKLGRGGLRDVEFTVQLLQLVHGRVDESIRSANTLGALTSLTADGYVGRDHAAELGECYRFLRVLEHRVQLTRMRRTHLLPEDEHELDVLARAARVGGGAKELLARWRKTRRRVRTLHEELFYRPLLPQVAKLRADDVSLDPQRAKERLRGIGYRDPAGAIRHLEALTAGVSRRASIQRQLLPVLLGWFAEGSDPDGALLAFRKLSDSLGSTHWYLKLLRDSAAAGERLAHILSSSTYAAERIAALTDSVRWLDTDAELEPKSRDQLDANARAMLARRGLENRPEMAVRFLRRRELTRAAIIDTIGEVPVETGRDIITPAAEVALVGALKIAETAVTAKLGFDEAPSRMLVVAMGRLGGGECSYASDADVMFVHDPLPGADATAASKWAHEVAASLQSLLTATGSEPALVVDANLRPEGRQGAMVRTLASYEQYYQRWAQGWERQALLRARPVAGDFELGERFTALIDPLRYPSGGVDLKELRELRRIKARVESERMPRGVPVTHHLKLGRGGLADVEWTVQLLQLRHGAKVAGLRVTGTLAALGAAEEAGLLGAHEAEPLAEAWVLATRLRNANVLASGRTNAARIDAFPAERSAIVRLSRLMGYPAGHADDLEQDWLRAGRRARRVMEEIFYG